VTVWYYVSNTHKVMTVLILVVLFWFGQKLEPT
jgi:hypothetical protein